MNLRARFLGLMLALAPFLFSCGDDEETEIGLPPQNDLGIFFAEIPLRDVISQVWVDDIPSNRSNVILAGSYTDEIFGKLKSQHFTELLLPSINPGKSLQADAQFDSLVLELRINGVYGNQLLTNEQLIEVYQLLDTIPVFEQTYYNNSTQGIGTKLGEASFLVHTDSIGLNFDQTGIPDSLFDADRYDENDVYIYRTRIRLDDAFGAQFFSDMKSDTTENSPFGSSNNFAEYFKGLNIQGSDLNTAIMRWATSDVRTRMFLYYSQVEDDSLVGKSFGFPLNQNINYNNIEPNADVPWMGSPFDDLNEFYTQVSLDTGYAFAQAGTNMFFSIDLSFFENFADTLNNPIIQSAVLVLPNSLGLEDTENVLYPGPNFLSFTITTVDSLSAGYPDVFPEVFSELPDKDVELGEDNGGYRVEMPVYLQGILDKRNPLNQIVVSAGKINTTFGTLTPDNGSFRRAIFDTDDIVIRLYYTIPETSNNE